MHHAIVFEWVKRSFILRRITNASNLAELLVEPLGERDQPPTTVFPRSELIPSWIESVHL